MSPDLVPEDIYEYTELRDVAVSPDGDRVAFVVHRFDESEDRRRPGLFVAPADGSREPHRLTRASDASAPVWGPDGDRLGFLAARERDAELEIGPETASSGEDEEDGDGDEDEQAADGGDDEPRSQVWVFDLARGGDARQVTDREEGVRGFDWGPDGERIVVDARDPTDEQAERRRFPLPSGSIVNRWYSPESSGSSPRLATNAMRPSGPQAGCIPMIASVAPEP